MSLKISPGRDHYFLGDHFRMSKPISIWLFIRISKRNMIKVVFFKKNLKYSIYKMVGMTTVILAKLVTKTIVKIRSTVGNVCFMYLFFFGGGEEVKGEAFLLTLMIKYITTLNKT